MKAAVSGGAVPVPVQSLVVEAVEEVRLCAHGSHVRMDAQELQESSSAALLHPDDDGLGELFAAKTVRDGHVGGRSRAPGPVRQLPPDQRVRGRAARAGLLALEPIVGHALVDEVHRCGQGVTVSVEAVKQVREEKDHGKEDGQLGLRLDRSSPFTPSHGSGARGARSMAHQAPSCH